MANRSLHLVCLADATIVHIDQLFAESIGLRTNAQLVGKTCQELFPPQILDYIEEAHRQAQKKRSQTSFEYPMKGYKALIQVEPLVDAEQNCYGFSWHGEEVAKATVNFESVFDNATMGQWLIDLKPINAVLEKHGIFNEQQLEHYDNCDQLLSECRWRTQVLECNQFGLYLLRAETAQDFRVEFIHHFNDESWRQLLSYLLRGDKNLLSFHQVIYVEDKKYTYWFTARIVDGLINFNALDASEFKNAEESLASRETHLGAIFKTVPDFLMVYNFMNNELLLMNRNLFKYLGYKQEEIDEHENMLDYITHSRDRERISAKSLEGIHESIIQGQIYESKVRLRTARGDLAHFHFRSVILKKEESNELSGNAVIVCRDITEELYTQKALDEQQRQYQLLADNFSDIVITANKNLKVKYVSSSIKHVLGYDKDDLLKAEDPLDFLKLGQYKDQLLKIIEAAQSSLDFDNNNLLEIIIPTSAGQQVLLEAKASILRDEEQEVEGLLIVLRDISERRKHENSQMLASKVFENSIDSIYITDKDGKISQVNSAFCESTGYSADEVVGKKPSVLSAGWHDIDFTESIIPAIGKDGHWSGELMSRRKNGEAFYAAVNITDVKSVHDEFLGLITSFKDITEAKNSEENIKKLAYYDLLTNLPNRSLFNDRLQLAINQSMRSRSYIAVLFLDLDGFKAVNDSHGHAVGDKLLKDVAQRLVDNVRSEDTIARMGGDEFTIILQMLKSREQAETAAAKIASKIIEALNIPFEIGSKTLSIGTSIGISLYPDDSIDLETLVKQADTAMYHAKSEGKNQYQYFTKDMHQRAEKRQETEKQVQQAIAENEFVLAYQPQLDPQGNLYGLEALLRWRHKDEVLLPSRFINVFEDADLAHDMSQKIISGACLQIKILENQGLEHCKVSANIFPQQFKDNLFVDKVKAALQEANIKSNQLMLEVGEAILMEDLSRSYAILSDLKRLGVKIAIDDFASGMLSLQHLRKLPIDEVKIDRKMLINIDKDESQRDFLKALIALAKSLGFDVVMEGIETAAQQELAQQLGSDFLQGYLLSKPLMAEQLEQYLKLHHLN